jgi:hypothetical protein
MVATALCPQRRLALFDLSASPLVARKITFPWLPRIPELFEAARTI